MIGMAASGISSLSPSLAVVVDFDPGAHTAGKGLMPCMERDALFNRLASPAFLGCLPLLVPSKSMVYVKYSIASAKYIGKKSKGQQRYRHIFSNAPLLGIFHYDVESVIVDCNEEFVRILLVLRENSLLV
jgi:PAS domain-containing protein